MSDNNQHDDILADLDRLRLELDETDYGRPSYIFTTTETIEAILACKVVSTEYMDKHWPTWRLPNSRALQTLPDGTRVYIVGVC